MKPDKQEVTSDTFPTIEDTYTAIPAIKYFVSFKCRIRICFDPDSCHCIIKDFILLQQSQAAVVDQDTTILTAPNFITSDYWIAARSESNEQAHHYNMATFPTFNCNNSYAKIIKTGMPKCVCARIICSIHRTYNLCLIKHGMSCNNILNSLLTTF